MILTLIIILIVISLIYLYFTWEFDYFIKHGVPGPKPIIFLGTFAKSTLFLGNITDDIDQIYKKYRQITPITGVFMGRNPQFLILQPNTIKDIFIRNFKYFNKSELADMIDKETDPIFARNPFMLAGNEWKEKRAEITPGFAVNRIKAMYPRIDDICKRMTHYIKQEIVNENPDGMEAKELAAKFTTDVVSSCIYGIDSKAFIDKKSVIREMGAALFSPSLAFIMYTTLSSMFPYLPNIYKLPFVPKKVEVFFTEIMHESIRMRESCNIEQDDYLNYLLHLRKKKNLSDIEMAAHSVSFFLDGFETSSIVISYMLYSLGQNKHVQNKLREEIRGVLNDNEAITFETITNLQYLDQVFNETLRMYPPITYLSKKCTETTELIGYNDKSLTIQKDMIVHIPIYSVQRDPDYYENPEEFNPDRFDTENGGVKKFKDLGVFLAFGDGPRTCLGMKFGATQTKAGVVEIIRNFEISVNRKTKEPLVLDPAQIFCGPIGGLWLDFKKI